MNMLPLTLSILVLTGEQTWSRASCTFSRARRKMARLAIKVRRRAPEMCGRPCRTGVALVLQQHAEIVETLRQHHLIVTHEVTNSGSDRSQLANIAKQAKADRKSTR